MIRFLRFFYRGPGAILVVLAIALGVAAIIKNGQDKQRAELEKRQAQRELGKVNPQTEIDKSQASKEVILSDRRLNPGNRTAQPELSPAYITQAPSAVPRSALQQLVSFYTQVPSPSPSPTPEPSKPKEATIWLPRGIFIPCALVNTVESSHINTPVVGEVIRDVFQNGHLIIPAGAIATCFAQAGAVRDRIEVAGKWSLVYPDGKEFELEGVACDREADTASQQFGIEDGSAGLQGELIESDHWANAKAFIALLMTATLQTGTAVATSTLQAAHTTGVTAMPDTTPILAKYLDQLLNGETGDGRFVRVRASKEFYIFPSTVVFPTQRSVGARRQQSESAESTAPSPTPADPVQAAIQAERDILKQSQQPSPSDENQKKFHY
jgi:hypothetical protein